MIFNQFSCLLLLCSSLALTLAGCDSSTTPTSTTLPASSSIAMDSFPTQSYPAAQLAQDFTLVKREDDPNPALHYQLLVPKNWQRIPVQWQPLTLQHPSQLQEKLQAPTDVTPVQLKVALAYLQEEVNPADLLIATMHLQGEKIIRQRTTPQPGGAVPDILTLYGKRGEEQISRWTVRKNALSENGGAAFFIISVGTLANNYSPEMAKRMGTLINEFELLHPVKWPYSEQIRTLQRTVPAQIETVFPISWQQIENPRSDEHFYQVKLIRKREGTNIGVITLTLFADQTAADTERMEEEARAAYMRDGVNFAASVFEPAPDFGGFTHVQQAISPQLDAPVGEGHERHVVTGLAGRYWLHMEIVQYAREAAWMDWAIAKRGFEIVQEHLKIRP